MTDISDLKYGLIGKKLSHSFSPQIHLFLGNGDYRLIELEENEIEDFFRESTFKGINITIPYKKTVIPFCDVLSEEARITGAVNTIVRLDDGKLFGDNTDCYGFTFLLDKNRIGVEGKKCLIIGEGGAARAVAYSLAKKNPSDISFLSHKNNRTDYINANLRGYEIIINASPVGMYPGNGVSPVDLSLFDRPLAVIDLIYNPRKTALNYQAEKLGITCYGGMIMLAAQAAESHKLFSGEKTDDGRIVKISKTVEYMNSNIILIGMPGSGKTTIGRKLASILRKECFDSDEVFAMRNGITPAEYIKTNGENAFRIKESEIIRDLTKQSGIIISTGGGAPVYSPNEYYLKQNSIVFFIKRNLSDLSRSDRPLSSIVSPEEMASKRYPVYERLADHSVDFTSSDETASVIAKIYNNTINKGN